MRAVYFIVDGEDASSEALRKICKQGSQSVGRQTRRMNATSAKLRRGQHKALSAEEKARRKADRRRRAEERKAKAEELVDVARMRKARRRAELEEESLFRRRIRVRTDPDKRSKVTAAGGRSLARSYERFERVTLPVVRRSSAARTSPLVFRIKARSLGGSGRSRWRRGELQRFGRYLVRLTALEGKPDESVFTNISDERAGSDMFVRELSDFLNAYEALETAADPKGQVYKSVILPLPHDVGFEARRAIAANYSAALSARKLPHVVVLHSPDQNGDDRNYHLHALVLMREFERCNDLEWAFAPTKSRDVFHPAMLKAWRRYTVALFNRELAIAHSERRYTLVPSENPIAARGRMETQRARDDLAEKKCRLEQYEAQATAASAISDFAGMLAPMAAKLASAADRLSFIRRRERLQKLRETKAMLLKAQQHRIEIHGRATQVRTALLISAKTRLEKTEARHAGIWRAALACTHAQAKVMKSKTSALEKTTLLDLRCRAKLHSVRASVLALRDRARLVQSPRARGRSVLLRKTLQTLRSHQLQAKRVGEELVWASEDVDRRLWNDALRTLSERSTSIAGRASSIGEHMQNLRSARSEAQFVTAAGPGAANSSSTKATCQEAADPVPSGPSAVPDTSDILFSRSGPIKKDFAKAKPLVSQQRYPDRDNDAALTPPNGRLQRTELKRTRHIEEQMRRRFVRTAAGVAGVGKEMVGLLENAQGVLLPTIAKSLIRVRRWVFAHQTMSTRPDVRGTVEAPPEQTADQGQQPNVTAEVSLSKARLAAFDRAVKRLPERAVEDLNPNLAHVRIALREDRILSKRSGAEIILAAEDQTAFNLLASLSCRPAGMILLGQIASSDDIPENWLRLSGVIPEFKEFSTRFHHAVLSMNDATLEHSVSMRNELCRQTVAGARSGLETFDLDRILRALEDERMTMAVAYRVTPSGGEFELAAANDLVLSELRMLANSSAGRRLLRALARPDILWGYSGSPTWAQWRECHPDWLPPADHQVSKAHPVVGTPAAVGVAEPSKVQQVDRVQAAKPLSGPAQQETLDFDLVQWRRLQAKGFDRS